MKKWLFGTIIITLVFAGFFYWKKLTTQSPNKVLSAIESPLATPRIWKQSTVVNTDEVSIRISWTVVNPKDVELYSNLQEKKLFEEIRVNKNCKILVNGGFYSKEDTHLGLFISDFKTLSAPIQSALLNGFLSIDSADQILIDSSNPNSPRIGLQTGPLLILDTEPQILKINNDEPERRIAAGKTADNKLIFLVFYKEKSDLEGPLLGKLPEIIISFKNETGIEIVDAINLDGGSASFFVTPYDLLREMTTVGSYFCVN